MSLSNAFETLLLQHLFNNDNIANLGDATGLLGSSSPGHLYVSLHTSDPGEGGSQNTNEANYTDYTRIAVARSGAGWTVTGNGVENAADIEFPDATGGSNTITHWGLGTSFSGAGTLLFKGSFNSSLGVSAGIAPKIPAGGLDITVD